MKRTGFPGDRLDIANNQSCLRLFRGMGGNLGVFRLFLVSMVLVLMSAGSAGAVTPVTGCGTLSNAGETYVLQNDISTSGTCFTIGADKITLDGAGYGIKGNRSGYGVYLSGRTNVAIKNLNIKNFATGIHLSSSSGNTLTNNNANSNNGTGIYLEESSDNTITDNNANSNTYNGICLISSSNNTITDNTASSNTYNGIYLTSSSDNTITNNTASNNQDGIYLGSSSDNNTITDNTANTNNRGINVAALSDSNTITGNTANSNNDTGIFFDHFSGNNTLTYNTASSNTWYGIRLLASINNTLTNNNASNNWGGIYLDYSNNNNIANNTANSNTGDDGGAGINLLSSGYNTLTGNTVNSNDAGIYLDSSSNNTLTNNTANSNVWYGINLLSSGNNTITNNTANSNTNYGIYLDFSSGNNLLNNTASSNSNDGIRLDSSSDNTITNNTASYNKYGIYLGSSSSNNTITNNTASSNNDAGIYLFSSSSNFVYNNLFNNTNNFYFDGTIYSSDWNTTKTFGTNIIGGSYLGGNFWAYPNGTGFSETCTDADSDGICDSNYTLASGNVDYLPLTFTVTPETFNITLSPGWNLISLPLAPENTSIDAVLASIEGNYSVVYRWTDCLWTKSTAVRNPLAEMTVEYGYWIGMTAPDTLELIGTVPTSTTINVTNTCWNLVGYPSPTTRNLTDVLSPINYTVVYAYINGVWKKSTAVRNPLTEMFPAYGYWINANEVGSYEVLN